MTHPSWWTIHGRGKAHDGNATFGRGAAFVAVLDLPIALVPLGFALVTLVAPMAFHRWNSRASRSRMRHFEGTEFLASIQGLATLKRSASKRSGPAAIKASSRHGCSAHV